MERHIYRKCRDNHKISLHPQLMPPTKDDGPDATSPEIDKPEKEDRVFNYASMRLSLGMFLCNFNVFRIKKHDKPQLNRREANGKSADN